MSITELQPRGAQERYAQQLLDWLYGTIEPDEKDKRFFEGSLTSLLKDLIPKAQYGDVVNRILVPSGAMTRVYNGCWQIHRQQLFPEDRVAVKVQSADRNIMEQRMTAIENRMGMLEAEMRELQSPLEATESDEVK